MKHFLMAAALAAVAATTGTTSALAADVGVSISLGQPGFYGQIDIGDYYPRPRVLYRQPMVLERSGWQRQPIYLRVPPGHARNWRKHCREYSACGERVYFVNHDWYQREYMPRYQEQHRDRHDDRRDDRHDRREGNRDDHRGDHRYDQRGDNRDNRDGRGNDHDGRGNGR